VAASTEPLNSGDPGGCEVMRCIVTLDAVSYRKEIVYDRPVSLVYVSKDIICDRRVTV
jgi:hypothetical protein